MYRTQVVKFETRPQMNTPINRSITTVSLAIGVEVTGLGVVFALLHASAFFCKKYRKRNIRNQTFVAAF